MCPNTIQQPLQWVLSNAWLSVSVLGCKTSLLRVTNDMLWAMEHKWVTAMIMMDLSAAFNTVDYNILLEVLNKKFGIEPLTVVHILPQTKKLQG